MKKLLILTALSVATMNSLLASEIPCKFMVRSNMVNNITNEWHIDGNSEAVLIAQGKEVTRSNKEVNVKIYITQTFTYKETIIRDILRLGDDVSKKLTIDVQRNDGVVTFTKTIRGDNSDRNKEKLLNSLKNMNFKCKD